MAISRVCSCCHNKAHCRGTREPSRYQPSRYGAIRAETESIADMRVEKGIRPDPWSLLANTIGGSK